MLSQQCRRTSSSRRGRSWKPSLRTDANIARRSRSLSASISALLRASRRSDYAYGVIDQREKAVAEGQTDQGADLVRGRLSGHLSVQLGQFLSIRADKNGESLSRKDLRDAVLNLIIVRPQALLAGS